MNALNIEVLKTLKCPCCFRYMNGPIYECASGHSICNSCMKIQICPICDDHLTDTRNFSLENLSKVVHYPCVNERKGCHQYFSLQRLNEHVPLCNFRTYGCRLDQHCSWEGQRNELTKHYLHKHENNVLIGTECVCLWKYDKPEYSVHMMLAFDEAFYVHRKLKNNFMYWAVQYIGKTEDVILFCFEISISTDQFNDRKLEFSEICHDDLKEDIDEIIDTGFCVAVPMTILETYFNTYDAVFYKIKIKKA